MFTFYLCTHFVLLGKAILHGSDVILYGADMYLFFNSTEQPATGIKYNASLQLTEINFLLSNRLPAKREHIMTVLENLKGIYIKGTYWSFLEHVS